MDHPLFTKSIPSNFDTNTAFMALVHLSSEEEEPKRKKVRRTIQKNRKFQKDSMMSPSSHSTSKITPWTLPYRTSKAEPMCLRRISQIRRWRTIISRLGKWTAFVSRLQQTYKSGRTPSTGSHTPLTASQV